MKITKESQNTYRNRKRSTMQVIKDYQARFDQSKAMRFAEASEIVCLSHSKMEIVGNGYLFGYMRGSEENKTRRHIPVYNIPQMSDEEWSRLAAKNKAERQVLYGEPNNL